jgi:hypothetical protein
MFTVALKCTHHAPSSRSLALKSRGRGVLSISNGRIFTLLCTIAVGKEFFHSDQSSLYITELSCPVNDRYDSHISCALCQIGKKNASVALGFKGCASYPLKELIGDRS